MKTLVIRGGLIHTVAGSPLEHGSIIVKDGLIEAVGTDIAVPSDAEVIDARDKVITPGLVEAHAHLSIFEQGMGWEGSDGDEVSEKLVFPQVRAIDALNPFDAAFRDALSAGVTTAHVPTSSLSLISGQTLVLKTPPKPVVDDMVIQNPAGLKMALGENPKRENALSRNRYPKTRLGLAATIREALVAAHNYRAAQAHAQQQGTKPAARDLGMEALVGLLERKYPIHMHAHRADDIVTAVRIAEEFNVKLVVHHSTEAYKVVDFLVKHQIPLAYGPFTHWNSKVETRELDPAGVRTCMEAGLKVAITTDHPVVPIQHMMTNVNAVIRAGLSPELALKALTLYPAEILGLGDRVGSLEPGKDADIVIFSDDPFSSHAFVETVYVNGERAWER